MGIFLRTLLLGVVSGSVYALASVGMVLTYKTSGILNFGYGALAIFVTFFHWQMAVAWGMPLLLSAAICLFVIAPLIGLALGALFRPMEGQPQIIGVIATVGLSVLLQGITILVWGPEVETLPSIFPQGAVSLLGVNIGLDQLLVLFVAGLSAAALGALLRFTPLGIAFRAVVNNREMAGIVGVNTRRVSALSWALSTSFAALFGILLLPRLFIDPIFIPPLIISFILAAAVVGYLRSLPLAYAGGLALGIGQALIIQYGSEGTLSQRLSDALPFAFITIAVLAAPRALRLAGQGANFIVRTRELASTSTPAMRAWGAAVFFGALALVPVVLPSRGSVRDSLILGMGHAILFLSLVIVTGYSGQISLGQTGFMGLATFVMANLIAAKGVPVPLAFAAGVLAAIPAGALIGFIAIRLHGLYLALITLAFAYMADGLFFQQPWVSGGEGGIAVPRPGLFSSDKGLYYLCWLVLGVCIALAVTLRTGRTGRILAAMRDSETACRSLGISVTRYKVLIFSLSAAMAGTAAILLQMFSEQATSRTFTPYLSLVYMTLAVLGGIFHIGGAIAAGMFYGLLPELNLVFLDRVQFILFGLGATVALAWNPEGMFGEMRRGANAILLAVRRRRRPDPLPVSGGQR